MLHYTSKLALYVFYHIDFQRSSKGVAYAIFISDLLLLKLILYTCTSELLDKLTLKFSFQLSSRSEFANLVRRKKTMRERERENT